MADRKADDYLDRLDAAFTALTANPPAPREAPAEPERDEAVPRHGDVAGSGTPEAPSLGVRPRSSPAEIQALRDQALPLSDAAVDAIAARVIARIGDAPLRQAVLDVAERLVREEIARIKSAHRRR